MSQNPEVHTQFADPPSLTTCSNCHSAMPSELRFCRNCGFRLGEGVAEYTETVRFGDVRGPLVSSPAAPEGRRRRKKLSGMAWVFIALLVFFVGAAAFTAILSPSRNAGRSSFIQPPSKPKSY